MSERKIPVVKGGPGAFVIVETETLAEYVYAAALDNGLKTIVNGGATKLANVKDAKDEAEAAAFREAAIAKAQERVAAMMIGAAKPIKLGRAAAVKGPSGAVMTEARRIARQLIKDTLKANGLKVSHYSASEITAKANELLADPEQGPGFIKMAEENLAKRETTTIKLDLSTLAEDPNLVAKAEEAKLKKKAGTLSATQAGKVAPRATKH